MASEASEETLGVARAEARARHRFDAAHPSLDEQAVGHTSRSTRDDAATWVRRLRVDAAKLQRAAARDGAMAAVMQGEYRAALRGVVELLPRRCAALGQERLVPLGRHQPLTRADGSRCFCKRPLHARDVRHRGWSETSAAAVQRGDTGMLMRVHEAREDRGSLRVPLLRVRAGCDGDLRQAADCNQASISPRCGFSDGAGLI